MIFPENINLILNFKKDQLLVDLEEGKLIMK